VILDWKRSGTPSLFTSIRLADNFSYSISFSRELLKSLIVLNCWIYEFWLTWINSSLLNMKLGWS